jgi:hypothetical protein
MSSAQHTHCGHLQGGPAGLEGGGSKRRFGGGGGAEEWFTVCLHKHLRGKQGTGRAYKGGPEQVSHGTQAATLRTDHRNEGEQHVQERLPRGPSQENSVS